MIATINAQRHSWRESVYNNPRVGVINHNCVWNLRCITTRGTTRAVMIKNNYAQAVVKAVGIKFCGESPTRGFWIVACCKYVCKCVHITLNDSLPESCGRIVCYCSQTRCVPALSVCVLNLRWVYFRPLVVVQFWVQCILGFLKTFCCFFYL